MKLPPMHMIPIPEAQLQNSANWMAEWEIEQKLTHVSAPEEQSRVSGKRLKTKPGRPWRPAANPMDDPFPAPGHIRLLNHAQVPVGSIMQYVAVLSRWSDGLLMVAPFSGYLHPATRGELLTGRSEPQLAVICLWSAISVHPLFLAQSWCVGKLSPDIMRSAWKVFQHAATGAPIPSELEAHVGAPIVHPLDPRIHYQRMVSKQMSVLFAQTATILKQPAESPAMLSVVFGPKPVSSQLAAARAKTADMREDLYAVSNSEISMRVTTSTDGRHCEFAVFNARNQISMALDAAIVEADATYSRPFRNGQTRLPLKALRKGFRIRLSDGCCLRLRKKS